LILSCKSFDKISSSEYVGKEFVTESGLKYSIHRAGDGKRAEIGDLVSVHYRGRLTDSTEFDNSYKRNSPFRFELGAGMVIKGWDEGIALLNVGDSATLNIPADLAYGDKATGIIPANAALIFDVELIETIETAKPYNLKGLDTTVIQEGLKIVWVTKNESGKQAVEGSTVKVHYSGYLKSGKKFDSSIDRGEPIEFPLGQGRVIEGWDIGISKLKTGEKARLIISSEMGYGSKGYQNVIPPNASLYFDVELLEVK
jgi:peptidylprolyl isomerase